MKITGEQRYDVPRETVWKAILDPEVLSHTLPGCEDLEQTGENEFSGKLKMKVGPVQSAFQGKVTLSDLDPPNGYRLKIDGRGPSGFMNGDGRLTLTEDGDGTILSYDIEAQVGGRIASVGQRLLESSAKVITRQGLEGLGRQLDAIHGAAGAPRSTSAESAAESAAESSSEASAAGPPPSQAKFVGAVIRGVAGDLVPKERRPYFLLGALLLIIALVAVFLRTCG